MLARVRALPVRQRAPVMQHFRMLTVIHVGAEEGEFLELDDHVGGRARGEAEFVSEAVSWVCGCGFCGVDVSGGGAWAIAPASHREPPKEGFKEEGE